MSTPDTAPPLGPRRTLAACGVALVLAHLALFVAVVVASPAWTLAAAVATLLAELAVDRRARAAAWALDRVRLGDLARGLLRGLALTVLAARLGQDGLAVAVAATTVLVAGGHAVRRGTAEVVEHMRRPPVLATGLTLDLPPLPAAPRLPRTVPGIAEVLAAAAVLVGTTSTGARAAVVVLLLAATATSAGPAAVHARYALALRRQRPRERVPAAIVRALAEVAPDTVVYYGDSADWQYQIEVWLPTLERLQHSVLVVVRDREVLRTLPLTDVPVICVPTARTLLSLPLPSVRAALYVGNNATNLHLLRRTGVRSAFIGHGDSDKGASANPFSRVYHEIWVAGPAGRQRYRDAGVEVPDSSFVEVGRPQVAEIGRIADAVPRPTVLYAPTWEGWGEGANTSSIAPVGPHLIRTLLARGDVRVMYRPHPRAGHLDAATRVAHEQILDLLRAAGADPARPTPPKPVRAAITARDALERTLQPAPRESRAVHEAATAAWTDAFWADRPGHRILTEPAPDLYACFAAADVLISDISSVTSDFLAADRPYAVVNTHGEPEDEFRAAASITGGGVVIGPNLTGLDELLAAATAPVDPTARARAATRARLVTAYGAPALTAFDDAITQMSGS